MGIEAILSKQFFVCSLFDDFPLVQNDHFFRPLRNGQAMGDEYDGLVQLQEIVDNLFLCQDIQIAGCFVEN